MYKTINEYQPTFQDFNQSCGMQLSSTNEWCCLASKIPWSKLEKRYAINFPSHTGRRAYPVRMVLGALIIQKRMSYSDRVLVKQIAENPYYQYFIGLHQFSEKCPFVASALVSFRKRLNAESIIKINEIVLEDWPSTPEHQKEKHETVQDGENVGTMILDATVSPANIRYPQDFSLLNEAREKTDLMIDILHKQSGEKLHPRTYKEVLYKAYLNVAKSKKRSAKTVRALIYKLLYGVKRNLKYIGNYLNNGGILSEKNLENLENIKKLYLQQKEIFDRKTHRVGEQIVSVTQPYLRPIVRGKTKAPVEFGLKYDVSIDEKGHARIEKLEYSSFNECKDLPAAVEKYKTRIGHYPRRVLVDKIYNTKENREYCQKRNIRISGRGPGRPAKLTPDERQTEREDNVDRIEIERFFSRKKRVCGAALLVTKLHDTTMASVALSVLIANLFEIPFGLFFIILFSEDSESDKQYQIIEFFDGLA